MSVAAPDSHAPAGRLWAALLASTLLNLPLGSVYSFSVLLRPLEQDLGVSRSALSLVFGLATAGFTVGSVGAAFLYRLAPAPVLDLRERACWRRRPSRSRRWRRARATAAGLWRRLRHRAEASPTSCASRA
jgi:hypothetical protein